MSKFKYKFKIFLIIILVITWSEKLALALTDARIFLLSSSSEGLEKPPNIALLPFTKLYEKARMITVKVILPNLGGGSGIIIERKGRVYRVLTNEHVVKRGRQYIIKTYNEKKYNAKLIEYNFKDNDLAILEFEVADGNEYELALPDNTATLRENDVVFAAGYPREADPNDEGGFVFIRGRILFKLDKPLKKGYQIGLSNNFEKGMSGGPLLNRNGELVGINGRHKPLWRGGSCPYEYKDDTLACRDMNNVEPNSWTIPLETYLALIQPSLPPSQQYRQALEAGRSAAEQGKTAQSVEEWQEAVQLWRWAIILLQSVPSNTSDYQLALNKIKEYQGYLDIAEEQLEKKTQLQSTPNIPDYFQLALEEEIIALNLERKNNNKSPEQWLEIAKIWQKAIELIKEVSSEQPNYQEARDKIKKYEERLEYARQKTDELAR